MMESPIEDIEIQFSIQILNTTEAQAEIKEIRSSPLLLICQKIGNANDETELSIIDFSFKMNLRTVLF